MCSPHFCSKSRSAQAGALNRSEAETARHSGIQQLAGTQTTRSVAHRAALRGRSAVNITKDVRKYAAEQKISEEEALNKGMEDESREFVEKGTELYAKA